MHKRLRLTSVSLGAVLLAIGTIAMSTPADAMPAFAREYRLNCSTCHQLAAPRLNTFGRHFMELGYKMPEGAERPVTTESYVRQDEKLALLERLPLALRIKNAGTIKPNADDNENKTEFNTPLEMHLLAGGSLFHNMSFFVNFPFFNSGTVGEPILAFVQFNIGEPGTATLRVGKFNILGLQFPNHRALTQGTAAAPAVQVGLNPVVLDEHQTGVEIFGRPGNGRVSYELAAVTGAGPIGAGDDHAEGAGEGGHAHGGIFQSDGNDFKDIYGRVSYSTASWMHTVGLLAYVGRTDLGPVPGAGHEEEEEEDEEEGHEDGGGSSPTDNFRIIGVDGEMTRNNWNLRSALYFGHHGNPFGTGVSVNYQSVLSELSYSFSRRLLGMLHYDQVFSSDLTSLKRNAVVPHLSYLLLDNVRLSAEYVIDLEESDRSAALLLLDMTM